MKALFALFAVSVSTTVMAADADLLRCRALADAPSKLACYDAIPVGAAAPAAPASAANSTFGLTAGQMRKTEQEESVESALVGTFSGWRPGTNFRLANGQTWRVVDDTSASHYDLNAPKVVIKRSFFGTYFLDIEGVNQAPRVRRID